MDLRINPLSSDLITQLKMEPIRAAAEGLGLGEEAGNSFSDILTESFKTASVTDTTDKVSALQLLAGETDDLSGLLLDATKAEISLNLALQIRNKIIDAYNEIMRMSV